MKDLLFLVIWAATTFTMERLLYHTIFADGVGGIIDVSAYLLILSIVILGCGYLADWIVS